MIEALPDQNRLRRRAFSLVELLCVISIVGALLGILLPAVQNVRESARSLSCQSKVRQLAIGVTNFEGTYKEIPPGTLGARPMRVRLSDFPSWEEDASSPFYLHNNQNTSWIVLILPFIEKSSLRNRLPAIAAQSSISYLDYKRIHPNAAVRLIDDTEVQIAMNLDLPMVLCPSDDLSSHGLMAFKCGSQPAYFSDLQEDLMIFFNSNQPMKATNYAACSGAGSGSFHPLADIAKFGGVFQSRSGTRLAAVTDGLSNTVLIGETLGSISGGERTSVNPWMFAAMCRGRSDLGWMKNSSPRYPGLELIGDNWFAHQAGFGSKHPNGANFALADTSVRTIPRTIDLRAIYRLCGKADQEVE